LIPRGLLEHEAEDQLPDKDARIIVHCAAGGRGSLAARSLKEMGYTNVANMDGGVNAWRERGYETEQPRQPHIGSSWPQRGRFRLLRSFGLIFAPDLRLKAA
ncbi:MAG TPA: rhodanese-like domain-containing protein, partial [Rubrobacter sp.]|nr:rhodanese-like domain-containing protein [Rubrobacter sp.]